MADSLEEAGFQVTKILDADYKTLKRAMLDFGKSLRNSPDAGLFYYAGHGVQVRGENYLIPTNARINDEEEIELEAININSFLRVMNSSSSAINIVVLDACRNNPFARSFRSVSRGLAPVDAPKGTYIAYATSPGDVAADGDGENSPYSAALAKAIKVRGINIEKVFKQARKSVLDSTDAKQVPWETSSITGEFYFHKQDKTENISQTIIGAESTSQRGKNIVEIEYWNSIKDVRQANLIEAYINRYPNGQFVELANLKIKALNSRTKAKQGNNPTSEIQKYDGYWRIENVSETPSLCGWKKQIFYLSIDAGNIHGEYGGNSYRGEISENGSLKFIQHTFIIRGGNRGKLYSGKINETGGKGRFIGKNTDKRAGMCRGTMTLSKN